MSQLKSELKEGLRGLGAELVGVASLDRFEGVRPNEDPRELFPEARSIVVLGRAIPRGALRGMEEGACWGVYRNFGGDVLSEYFLPRLTYHATRFIEDRGWEAIPMHPYPPDTQPMGVAVAEDRVAPNVVPDIRYAAVAAGLGEIGRCGLLLTPRYGPLQRLHMIVTDAEIEPDPLFEGQVCDQCEECVMQCPHGALGAEPREVTIAGKTMLVSDLDISKCRVCGSGQQSDLYDPEGEPDRLPAACGRACVAHLMDAGLLELKYQASFRKRDPWFPRSEA